MNETDYQVIIGVLSAIVIVLLIAVCYLDRKSRRQPIANLHETVQVGLDSDEKDDTTSSRLPASRTVIAPPLRHTAEHEEDLSLLEQRNRELLEEFYNRQTAAQVGTIIGNSRRPPRPDE